MTPHELVLHIHAHIERERLLQNQQMTMAYLTAKLGRVKKMPDLKKLLEDEPQSKEQTPEDMWSKMIELNAKFGGTTY
jgi:hypothetical protein